MNCKPGDLAVTVNMLNPMNNGRLVRVLRAALDGELIVVGGARFVLQSSGPCWLCESEGPYEFEVRSLDTAISAYGKSRPIADRFLRPLRDPGEDASDEMFRPLPQEVAA